MSVPALSTQGLSKSWGDFKVNSDISLTLAQGARHALIGPNGAGKTTFIHLLTGYLKSDGGDIFLAGDKITKLSQHARVRRGMARTFQINTLFPQLTVLESVMLSILERKGKATIWSRPLASMKEEIVEARNLLESLRLRDEAQYVTQQLPYGKQRLVEIALALASCPKVLLLDEPAAGIPAAESAELFEVLSALPKDVAILIIEHDMDLVFRFAEKITVLVGGRVLTEGSPDQIANNAQVKDVYLGEAEHV
ncbi:MAG: ABC transporter ATP-binding protein [Pseudomonadota bacterium]